MKDSMSQYDFLYLTPESFNKMLIGFRLEIVIMDNNQKITNVLIGYITRIIDNSDTFEYDKCVKTIEFRPENDYEKPIKLELHQIKSINLY
jgi:hypothetical protein